jgi:hypothetical protein
MTGEIETNQQSKEKRQVTRESKVSAVTSSSLLLASIGCLVTLLQ